MRTTTLAAALALMTLVAADDPASTADRDRLQGDWTTKSFVIDGGPLPKEKQYPDRLLTFRKGAFSEFRNGKVAVRGTYVLDATKSPKQIDATFAEGGPVGETVRGIYSLDGDALRVCIGTPETERPTAFASAAGSSLRLIDYARRAKP